MSGMAADLCFDTSVIVYAFDSSEAEKHSIASKMIEKAMNEGNGVISSQVLLELYNVLTRFVTNPLPREDAERNRALNKGGIKLESLEGIKLPIEI